MTRSAEEREFELRRHLTRRALVTTASERLLTGHKGHNVSSDALLLSALKSTRASLSSLFLLS